MKSPSNTPVVEISVDYNRENTVSDRSDVTDLETSVEQMSDREEHRYTLPSTVFDIRLKQAQSDLANKMGTPEFCRKFSAVSWCGKFNIIACASETCAVTPRFNGNAQFWIPVHILSPERPTECSVFNVIADSPCDSIQFIEWSPPSCPRALLVGNFHGRVSIWAQPSQGPINLIRDAMCWTCEKEWRQDIAVVTKWLAETSMHRWFSSDSKDIVRLKTSVCEDKHVPLGAQTGMKWPSFLCVCSVFSSGSVQLHWSAWPNPHLNSNCKWFSTSKGVLGAGPSGLMAADAIVTAAGAIHIAGVPIVNPSTVVIWEVMPGPGNNLQTAAKMSTPAGAHPSHQLPCWTGFAPLAAYLFNWQEFLGSEEKVVSDQDHHEFEEVSLHCAVVSNLSAYVTPEASSQSGATTTWCNGVAAVAFDPTSGGSVLTVAIVEGQFMSSHDPDEGPRITGWCVQCWESSIQPVVLHPIFGNPAPGPGGQPPMRTVWLARVNRSIPPMDATKCLQEGVSERESSDKHIVADSAAEKLSKLSFHPFDIPSDVRTLARIVYSPHGNEVAVAFLRGAVQIFSGMAFNLVEIFHVAVGSAIAVPAFSSTGCCIASAWHDIDLDDTVVKILRVVPPSISSNQAKIISSSPERAIADRYWWSLSAGVDWWDVAGSAQSASEDGIVSLNGVIAVLDADFHSLLSVQHRKQHGPSLDRMKCRLLEGTSSQEARALVLDMQARLLLDMLGKGIESALVNPSTLVEEPWSSSGEFLDGIDAADAMTVEPSLVLNVQPYVDAVLDLSLYFISRVRRYINFCRTLASHTVGTSAGTIHARNLVASPTSSCASPASSQGGQSCSSGVNSSGSSQMQAWAQGAVAKNSSNTDASPSSSGNLVSGSSNFVPISLNSCTLPGTPAVRLIGDRDFLHRLCQLLLFCFFFRRRRTRHMVNADRNADSNAQRPQPASGLKSEESSRHSPSAALKTVETPNRIINFLTAKHLDDFSPGRPSRIGTGNAGQGYTSDEVKVLFLILVELCRRTSSLPHPLPVSQVGASSPVVRLHYVDGNYTVLPEVVEAAIGLHMQKFPRLKGSDFAGLLLRELELHPPAEEWHKRHMIGGLRETDDAESSEDYEELIAAKSDIVPLSAEYDDFDMGRMFFPKKRRFSERETAFGMESSVSLGAYIGIMGSRRDVITAIWKAGIEGVWYKCVRCLRQTSSFAAPAFSTVSAMTEKEAWWISRWANCCPMCGGVWIHV